MHTAEPSDDLILQDHLTRRLDYVAGDCGIIGISRPYLNVDRLERLKGKGGIILCAEKDNVDVELALEGVTKPIGVADYHLLIPKAELQKVVADEIALYEKERITEGN